MTESISLTYFAPRDVLIPRVARHCIMRYCEALSASGVDLELVSLGVRLEYDEPTRTRSLWEVYGIEHRFPVRVLPTGLRQNSSPRAVTAARGLRYGAYALRHGLLGRRLVRGDVNVLFTRNLGSARALLAIRRRFPGRVLVVGELHGPVGVSDAKTLRRLDGVICISDPIAEEVQAAGVQSERILVAQTGVSLEAFVDVPSQGEARAQLGLGPEPLVVYTGKVHRDSGEVDLLLAAARRLPPHVRVLLVGGREDHVETLRARAARESPTAVLAGFVAPSEVPLYQAAADVLVLYYPSTDPLFDYRSPAKLWEYLAAHRPVVSVDTRSVRAILGGGAGVLVPPDDPGALADAVQRVLGDPELAARMAEAGRRLAEESSWRARAERTLEFVDRVRRLPPVGSSR